MLDRQETKEEETKSKRKRISDETSLIIKSGRKGERGEGEETLVNISFQKREKLCGKLGVRGAIRKLHDEIINQRKEKRRNGGWLMARRGIEGAGKEKRKRGTCRL